MGRFRENAWLRAVVTTLYMVVAATIGFAHKPVALASADVDLALFRLPDGSLPILCQSTPDGENGKPSHADGYKGCDACRLTEQPGLGAVDPPELARLISRLLGPVAPRCEAAIAAISIAPSARGPPSGLTPTA